MTKKKENDYQLELFAPSFPASIAVKDQQDLMQYPFFSLSKSKRVSPIKFDDGNVQIDIGSRPDVGIASIFDADILIYVASQIMEAHNKGLPTSPEIKVSKYDILEFLGKATDGRGYQRLTASLERLQATSVRTTITRGDGTLKKGGFSWIESWEAVEKNGKAIAIRFRLANWLYEGILNHKVLTMDREYFRLEGGLERFLYRLCRKVVGRTPKGLLEMKLETIYKRSGSVRKKGAFRKMVAEIMEKQSIPNYWILVIDNKDKKPVILAIARQSGENISAGFERAMREWRGNKRLRAFRKNPKVLPS